MIGNVDEFILHIGIDNFEEFNKWIIDFYNTYQTPKDRLNMKNTTKYTDMINKEIIIIDKMKRHGIPE